MCISPLLWLCRVFGRKQYYACPLSLCIRCHALYWQRYGHPCPSAEAEAEAAAAAEASASTAPDASTSSGTLPPPSVSTTARRITSPPTPRASRGVVNGGGGSGRPGARVNGEHDDGRIYRDKLITPEKFVQLFRL